MPGPQDVSITQILLAEYQSIKEEQRARIGFRDNLLYVTLAAVTAVAAAAAQFPHAGLLLALPPVSIVLGWTYLVNDEKISAVTRYVRTDLRSQLGQAAAVAPEALFGWETAHAADRHRRSRKIIQCGVDLTAFCLVPGAAIVIQWTAFHTPAPLVAVSLFELVAIAGLGYQIIQYALPATRPW